MRRERPFGGDSGAALTGGGGSHQAADVTTSSWGPCPGVHHPCALRLHRGSREAPGGLGVSSHRSGPVDAAPASPRHEAVVLLSWHFCEHRSASV